MSLKMKLKTNLKRGFLVLKIKGQNGFINFYKNNSIIMGYSNTDLTRFLDAQNKLYLTAFSEMKKGKKESHWMWFIFPQIKGLGTSNISKFYAISDLTEAKDFLNHPILAKHLIEISELLLTFKRKSIESILGDLDARKLCSSMTLFSQVEGAHPVFQEIIDTFFLGYLDPLTLSRTSSDVMSPAVEALS